MYKLYIKLILVQMTLFRVINFLIYKEWKKRRKHRGMSVFQVRSPSRSQLFASVLPVELLGQIRGSSGASYAPKAAQLPAAGPGCLVPASCFLSSGHDASFNNLSPPQ